jgi:hypothetical protein
MINTNKLSLAVITCIISFYLCFAASSYAVEDKYVLEKETVYRVSVDGKRQKIEDIDILVSEIEGDTTERIFWFSVDSAENDSMKGSKSGIYFFDEKDNLHFFLPNEHPSMVSEILFSPFGEQMVLDSGTGVIREFALYDFKDTKKKASLRGMSSLVWIDQHRFVFTMDEPNVKSRVSATDYDGWSSVVVYNTVTGEITPVMTATKTRNYWLEVVNWCNRELHIAETSVENEQDWSDGEKYRENKITMPFP